MGISGHGMGGAARALAGGPEALCGELRPHPRGLLSRAPSDIPEV